MRPVFNFSAGPATLPEAVLTRAANEMLDWNGSGQCVMEMSHRGKEYMSIHAQAQADLRELLSIPDNYKVLFLQGGATLQFAMLPMNLLNGRESVDYVHTGQWSKKAIAEAKRVARVNIAANAQDKNFSYVPAFDSWQRDPNAAYLHYCVNETIGGVECFDVPDTGDVPLVADMSSTLLSRPIDVSKFGVIYAGAQKNIGPAGLTIVIIRDDLLGLAPENLSPMLSYAAHAEADSMLNTPPTYAVYVAGLVFQWLKDSGGLAAIEAQNIAKAGRLYQAIDASDFYANPVATANRSRMNVPFTLASADHDDAFLAGARKAGLLQLKGHRSVGGMRASIYNAMPMEGVDALIGYMNEFERAQA